MGEGRSLAETPTWSVATVATVMVAVCFVVERSIYRFGKWLRKTKRKALFASLEKIREELMLLGIISLLLSQTARWISQICVPSSLFSSRFYICSEDDFSSDEVLGFSEQPEHPNKAAKSVIKRLLETSPHQCGEDHEPFVPYEGLEQLNRFLFILGMTHILYSCFTVILAMIKIYSWRKWENQAYPLACDNLEARTNRTMKRQSTFVFHHTSHPWSKSKVLIWMLCFIRQFRVSITKSDYMALRMGFIATHKLPLSYDFHKYMVRSMEDEFHESVGISWPLWGYAVLCVFINIHGLNIYFWLSFIPAILVMLVGTKLQHVVAQLALEVAEPAGPLVGSQLKPRDDLFWFGKPEFLLWLIQFISFQNAFELATFIWSLWQLNAHSCFMRNDVLIFTRLICGILVQLWCSYSTLPLNVIVTQMGSKFKKSLIAESVRSSLHRWCRRVREKSKRDRRSNLGATASTCSLEFTADEREETTTVASGTLSRSSSVASGDQTLFTASSLEDIPVTCAEERSLFDSLRQGPGHS